MRKVVSSQHSVFSRKEDDRGKKKTYWLLVLLGCLLLTAYCFLAEKRVWGDEGWREARPGYQFSFPRDHAAHPDYRIEWWYYTGNVETREGKRFGYQLTFFRTGVVSAAVNPSRWAVRDLYMAHFAISDLENQKFYSFERLARAGVGWAGAETEHYRVWNETWEARLDGETHVLTADDTGFRLQLALVPEKSPVIHGENGVSQKGAAVGNASHYYSLTRLRTAGQITINNETFNVTGLSWMDHEFGTSFLEKEHIGWDWFSLQLNDGRELMIFQLRRADGSMDSHSSGTLIDANGQTTPISFGEFSLSPSQPWFSSATGAKYPTVWELEVPRLGLQLLVRAALPDQELRTNASTSVTYWEGSTVIAGKDNPQLTGRGYLEMTGYAGRNMGAVFGLE
jgi:predicted secreted hydrolase